MLAKLVFVLIIFSANGETQRFAWFETQEQCENFARSFNAGGGPGRAACLPENKRNSADLQKDFNEAMQTIVPMMSLMKKQLDNADRSN